MHSNIGFLALGLVLVAAGAWFSLADTIDYLRESAMANNGNGACLDEQGNEFLCLCSKNGCTPFAEVELEYTYRTAMNGTVIASGLGLLLLFLYLRRRESLGSRQFQESSKI